MTARMIAGRYQVERTIGKGGMGTVWLGALSSGASRGAG
jgi:hypothetical protein